MKVIAFDARMISHPGIGRYIRSLLQAIIEINREFRFRIIGKKEDLTEINFDSEHLEICHCSIPIYSFKEQFKMASYFNGADLVHVPHFNVPFFCSNKLIVTIHDLIYFKIPEYKKAFFSDFLLKRIFSHIGRKASQIIAVSNATKQDCLASFPSMADKTTVIHEAADRSFIEDNVSIEHLKKYEISRPYVLYVGSIREHKNVNELIEAFVKLKRNSDIDVDLILVGKLDERFDQKYGFRQILENNADLKHLSRVGDKDLKALYKHAQCTVMPSRYEGFGLPVLESMACGTPVVISNAPSLMEIAGDSALQFNVGEIDGLTDILYNVLKDNDLRKNLSNRGLQRAKEFSWHKAAAETLSLYQKTLS